MIEVDPRLQDHAIGLELQIVEVVHQVEDGAQRGWKEEEIVLQGELDGLYDELVTLSERSPGPDAIRQLQVFRVDSVVAGDTWSEFSRLTLDSGILSSLSVPLIVGADAVGTLSLYSHLRNGFDGCEQLGLAPAALAMSAGQADQLRPEAGDDDVHRSPPLLIHAPRAGETFGEPPSRRTP